MLVHCRVLVKYIDILSQKGVIFSSNYRNQVSTFINFGNYNFYLIKKEQYLELQGDSVWKSLKQLGLQTYNQLKICAILSRGNI